MLHIDIFNGKLSTPIHDTIDDFLFPLVNNSYLDVFRHFFGNIKHRAEYVYIHVLKIQACTETFHTRQKAIVIHLKS